MLLLHKADGCMLRCIPASTRQSTTMRHSFCACCLQQTTYCLLASNCAVAGNDNQYSWAFSCKLVLVVTVNQQSEYAQQTAFSQHSTPPQVVAAPGEVFSRVPAPEPGS